ncbi:hypothetical protein D9615_008914 [Tricholomella constricta]|uniref:FAR-17a/AIG1-like protein n=1 Tax=Tricholomella constricta TaxID=117010 RepID=A0A8H5LYW6_9AGAR|nr:hypothetical protein D9615_008914 [Tricholomella constricta]
MNLYSRLGVTQPFDSAHKHVTSPVVSAPVLASLRFLLAFYTLFTLLLTLIWNSVRDHSGQSYFSYFTHLSYIGLCAYFFASGVQTFAFARSLRPAGGAGSTASYPLQRWPRPLQFLHVLLQLTITTFPIVVTIVFWILLATPEIFNQAITSWSNISVHLLNTAFGLAEVFFTDIPPAPWLTLPMGILVLACYLGVAYITHDTQGFYPYSFLNPHKQKALLAAYIVGIAVGYCIIFLFVRLLIILRIRIVAWSRARRGAGSSADSEAIEDWEEVERPSKDAVRIV